MGQDGVGGEGSNTIGIAGLAVGGVGIVMSSVALFMIAQKKNGVPYSLLNERNDSPRQYRVVRVF